MIAFLNDNVDDDFDDDLDEDNLDDDDFDDNDFDDDDFDDEDFDDGDFEDEDDEMDPDEARRIATNLLGYDPSTVDQETLKRDIYAILEVLARRLAEL